MSEKVLSAAQIRAFVENHDPEMPLRGLAQFNSATVFSIRSELRSWAGSLGIPDEVAALMAASPSFWEGRPMTSFTYAGSSPWGPTVKQRDTDRVLLDRETFVPGPWVIEVRALADELNQQQRRETIALLEYR